MKSTHARFSESETSDFNFLTPVTAGIVTSRINHGIVAFHTDPGSSSTTKKNYRARNYGQKDFIRFFTKNAKEVF